MKSSYPIPHTDMVTLTEPPSTNMIGLVWGLPLGALLLAMTFLITTVAVAIAVRTRVQLARKKEEICALAYKPVGPPQQPRVPDPITTDVEVANASTSFNTT